MQKIFNSADKLLEEIEKIRKNKKIVFTNGCFDILHPGHVYILQEAAALGDVLIVGLNDDASVRKIKGDSRPLLGQDARAAVVSALEAVDYVVFFSEETPLELISRIRPDVLVKGGEYGAGQVVGEGIAGETVRIKMKPGYSTTGIIDKIIKSRRK
ncbi:MAG: adenylyltransferase/cytidyltransferase family protein [Elusimicrobia bacterium]|nr:adenylyltransferase/cytidyltransferase family protein [Elusimicrobiota bacterium]